MTASTLRSTRGGGSRFARLRAFGSSRNGRWRRQQPAQIRGRDAERARPPRYRGRLWHRFVPHAQEGERPSFDAHDELGHDELEEQKSISRRAVRTTTSQTCGTVRRKLAWVEPSFTARGIKSIPARALVTRSSHAQAYQRRRRPGGRPVGAPEVTILAADSRALRRAWISTRYCRPICARSSHSR